MKRRSIIIPLFCFILACSGCSKKTENDERKTKETSKFCLNDQLKKTTEIQTIWELPIVEQLTLSGKIEYNENELTTFKSLLEGVVEHVYFELGDYVKQNQVLAVIKSNQIQELIQQKRTYQNEVQALQIQLNSKRELLKDGMIAAPEVSITEHELNNAKIEVERLNQSLGIYRSVGNGSFQMVAPKNGYIIQKKITAGQTIHMDDEVLFSSSNLKQVWAMVNIYASNLKYIHIGDAVKVRTIAYPDQFYIGKIDKIYNVFDDDEHVLKARVVLDNQNLNLMPGLSADIVIDKKNTDQRAFAVPNKAIVFSNNQQYVVVYKDDCNLEFRKITPVALNEEHTFVKESFVSGEKIVASNALLLFEQLNQSVK